MSNPSIAVVIPAYNSERYICEALDSIITQTRLPEQIIVVDDGSTDHTCERIRDWRRQYHGDLSVLQQNNRGVSAARNIGIRRAHTHFIALLDADDLYLSHHLEQLERAFKKHQDLVLCFGDADNFDAQQILQTSILAGTGIEGINYDAEEDGLRFLHGSAYISLLRGSYILPSACMFSKNAVERVGFFDEALRNAEDRELFLRLSRVGPFAYYPHIIAHKRTHAMNLTHSRHLLQSQTFQFLVLRKMHDRADELELSVTERQQTQAAMVEHIRGMLYAASRIGLNAYIQTCVYLVRHRKISPVCNPKHLLRALWRFFRWLSHRFVRSMLP